MRKRGIVSGVVLLVLLIGVVIAGVKLFQFSDKDARWERWMNELNTAVNTGNQAEANNLLSQLKNPDVATNESKQTPLMRLCQNYVSQEVSSSHALQLSTIKALLNRGANPNLRDIQGMTALTYELSAASRVDIIETLLVSGADPNLQSSLSSPLEYTINGSKESMKALLKHGAKIGNGKTRQGMPYLVFAAQIGDLELIQTLLAKGARINQEGAQHETALSEAAKNGKLEAVKLLVSRGADVNHKDSLKLTVLSQARLSGDTNLMSFLEKHGAK